MGGGWFLVFEGPGRRFLAVDLTPGYTYRFRARAVNSERLEGVLSAVATATCRLAAPHAPVPLRVSATSAVVWLPLPLRGQQRDCNHLWSVRDFYALRLQRFMSLVLWRRQQQQQQQRSKQQPQNQRRQQQQQQQQRKKLRQQQRGGGETEPRTRSLLQEITLELVPEKNVLAATTGGVGSSRSSNSGRNSSDRQPIVHVVRRRVEYFDLHDGDIRLWPHAGKRATSARGADDDDRCHHRDHHHHNYHDDDDDDDDDDDIIALHRQQQRQQRQAQQTFCVRLTGLAPNTSYTVRARMRVFAGGSDAALFRSLQEQQAQVHGAPTAGVCGCVWVFVSGWVGVRGCWWDL